jgi:hypothetical protein
MKVRNAITGCLVAAAILVAIVPGAAFAQTLSNTANVALNATLAQTISVSVTSGSTVNFTLVNGSPADGDVPAVISTSWNLNPGLTGAVTLYGYFATPAQAMTDGGGNDIPTSLVLGRMATGTPTSYTAFTGTNPVGPAGGSLALFSEAITGANKIKTRSDNLDLRVDLTGQTIPAASYTGTLHIQARAL